MPKAILCVGMCVLDIIHVCEEFPVEDSDKRWVKLCLLLQNIISCVIIKSVIFNNCIIKIIYLKFSIYINKIYKTWNIIYKKTSHPRLFVVGFGFFNLQYVVNLSSHIPRYFYVWYFVFGYGLIFLPFKYGAFYTKSVKQPTIQRDL